MLFLYIFFVGTYPGNNVMIKGFLSSIRLIVILHSPFITEEVDSDADLLNVTKQDKTEMDNIGLQ